jgi:tetratricopeptide (TPR) repeat protein
MSKVAVSPYPGLRPFRQVDHDRFFGRATDATAIAGLWRDNRLTVVTGPVACGKTSLLQAGVFPIMTGAHADVLPPGRFTYGATFPFAALPELNSYTLALLRSWSPDEVATRLAGLSVGDFVRRRAQRHDRVVFAAIDQAEDLLIDSSLGSRRAWRRQFLAELVQAIADEPRLHLLVVARGEALDLISTTIGNGARYKVRPLTRRGALDAVTAPAESTGRRFAEGAAEKLVMPVQTNRITAANGDGERYVTGDVVEPTLLQVICRQLWRNLPPDATEITAQDVRAFGDADSALAEYCGEAIAAVAAGHDLTVGRLRSWLVSTFITDLGTRGTVYEGVGTTAGMPNSAARDLVDRHLLTTELKAGLRWYELLSDQLIEPLREATEEPAVLLTPAAYLQAAERALTLGELDLARQYAEQALRAEPDLRLRAEAKSLLGNLAYEKEKPDQASVHYREAAVLFEAVHDTRAAARQLAASGQMLLAQGLAAEAVSELHAAVSRVPNDLVMQTELALALWHLGEGRAAVAILTGVLGVDGGNTDALRARGEILADLGDARDAMLDLDRQIPHERPSTLAAHGLALAELGDQSAANRKINDALVKAPRNGQVLLYAARISALGGDEISSGELARRAVEATDPPLSPGQREAALRLVRHPSAPAGYS